MRPVFAALTLVVLGCTRPDVPVQSTSRVESKSAEPLPLAPPSASASAIIKAPEPEPIPSGASAPAYVLADYSGVLQIMDGGVSKVFPIPSDRSSSFTEITVSPAGTMWLSDYQGIRTYSRLNGYGSIRRVKDGPLYEKIIVRSENDAWAVSNDIEWSVLHYDGVTWKSVRQRKQFPGKYDDNKFSGLAVTSDGVWVSSWNGVWHAVGDKWENVVLPEGVTTGPDLLIYRDQLIVASPGSIYLRQSGTWKKLAWPDNILLRWVVSDLNLFAAPSRDKPRVVIGSVEGTGGFVESDAVTGRNIRALAFDGSGRLWVGTDQALAVLDRRGHLLTQWPAGTLEGLTAGVLDITVVGAGPATLPTPKVGKKWEIKGKFVSYKRSTPLAGATIIFCGTGAFACAHDPDAKRMTADARGGFRFPAVPDGEFRIEVEPPAGFSDCASPFTLHSDWVSPARDCHESSDAPGICDLGTLRTCLPFEMPPPPPKH